MFSEVNDGSEIQYSILCVLHSYKPYGEKCCVNMHIARQQVKQLLCISLAQGAFLWDGINQDSVWFKCLITQIMDCIIGSTAASWSEWSWITEFWFRPPQGNLPLDSVFVPHGLDDFVRTPQSLMFIFKTLRKIGGNKIIHVCYKPTAECKYNLFECQG